MLYLSRPARAASQAFGSRFLFGASIAGKRILHNLSASGKPLSGMRVLFGSRVALIILAIGLWCAMRREAVTFK
jgi:hypothetical protein